MRRFAGLRLYWVSRRDVADSWAFNLSIDVYGLYVTATYRHHRRSVTITR